LPNTTTASLNTALERAFEARSALIVQLQAEQTNAYRLFHGTVEGVAGLCVDRYGELLLVQSFHRPLPAELLEALTRFYAVAMPGLEVVYNDRSQAHSRIRNTLDASAQIAATQSHEVMEGGVKYLIQARHAGQDPWLFLDLRAARRRVRQEAAGKRLLNLFAYTCGVGVAAACAGASQVINVDFAESSLAVGKQNAQLNRPPIGVRFVKSDAFAAMRQFSGIGQPQIVRGKRLPPFPKLEKQDFDLVFLDPPRYAKSPFGVVDLIHDYPAVFKPALLCTAEGGTLICSNNVAEVRREAWLAQLERSALKAGRPIREIEWITPDTDFPCLDEQAPLKTVLLRV
jgi:23S rRNA (cytosine1962-C5)-methyltransferase